MKKNQATLAEPVEFFGYGVHSAIPCTVRVEPAPAGHGIVFVRHDGQDNVVELPAVSANTGRTDLCTVLGHGNVRVETIEHIMAAIYASHFDNLRIDVSANEIPILDGSSLCFMQKFSKAGHFEQDQPRFYIKVKEMVRVETQNGYAQFEPHTGCVFDVTIDFPSPLIGRQHIVFDLYHDDFSAEIASARTFGFLKDVETLWASGLALGSSLDNSVVIGFDQKIINRSGLHFENEFVRHKLLDSIGDMALLGYPFIGRFSSYKGGHRLNAELVKALLSRPQSYEIGVLSSFIA